VAKFAAKMSTLVFHTRPTFVLFLINKEHPTIVQSKLASIFIETKAERTFFTN
jgi:hypothetical protein